MNRPRVMGILNLTPDSFSDGGKYLETGEAVERGLEMARQGADIIDVGGESTRPGAVRVEAREQRHRVIEVIRGLRARLPAETGAEHRHYAIGRGASCRRGRGGHAERYFCGA